ncbi:hypothetical protein JTE90_021039 [Oedothorax gibbosus]|uniref:Invertebrate defensins family profile domain-containing protein n=1 Tax=Oedothorax gibbosus TaxID=931172 RepID=A0AAV6VQX0_9ARAC|nr:hypothetical protein JTE90_021039 [Oedothorax gibbosus]
MHKSLCLKTKECATTSMNKYSVFYISVVILIYVFISAEAERGIMCPVNSSACNEHCKKAGRKAGYCAGMWSTRCTCVQRGPSINSDMVMPWG